MPPRQLAELLAAELTRVDGIAAADVAGPGFINITVAAAAQGEVARSIVEAGASYGGSDALARAPGSTSSSSPPTRPARSTSAVRGGRPSATAWPGSSPRSAPTSAREYYFNDHGAQIDRFSAVAVAVAHGSGRCPRTATSATTSPRSPTRSWPRSPERARSARRRGAGGVPARRRRPDVRSRSSRRCTDFGVDFDVYFHEQSLHDSGAVERAIERLTEMGNTYEADGALWLRTEQYGDDKDRVIIRSNGSPAYIAGDCAYYLDKRERGFDLCVIMLGADHHGYVGRMMAMCQAFGDKPHENLEILIGQMVNLVRDGAAAADGQAGRHRALHRRPVECGRRRRRLAMRWSATPATPTSTSTSTLDPSVERQPRLLRAVRTRPALLDPAQRPSSSASAPSARRLRPGAAVARARG